LDDTTFSAIAEQRAEVILDILRVAYSSDGDDAYDGVGVLFTEWEIVGVGKVGYGVGEEEHEDELDEEAMIGQVERIILDEIPGLTGKIRFSTSRRVEKGCGNCGYRHDSPQEDDWVMLY
jgi:hypothetical protein